MNTDVLLGIAMILPNLVGVLMAIYPPGKRSAKAFLALLFVFLTAAGILLVVEQSKETEAARIAAENASVGEQAQLKDIERKEAETQQHLQEVRGYLEREKNDNSHLLATMEGMDKTVQLLRESATSPELQRRAEQAHKQYVVTMSEHLQTMDSMRAQKNPPSEQPQK